MLEMDKLRIKAAEDELSFAFQTGNEKDKDGLKNASLYSVETVLTRVVHCGTLVRTNIGGYHPKVDEIFYVHGRLHKPRS